MSRTTADGRAFWSLMYELNLALESLQDMFVFKYPIHKPTEFNNIRDKCLYLSKSLKSLFQSDDEYIELLYLPLLQ